MKERAVHHLNLCSAEAHLLSITTHDGHHVYVLSLRTSVVVGLSGYQDIMGWRCPERSTATVVGRMSALLLKRPKCELTGCAINGLREGPVRPMSKG
jgi:hypothetical protein